MSAHTLNMLKGNGEVLKLATQASFMTYLRFSINQGNSALTTSRGFVAVHLSAERIPSSNNAPWSHRNFQIDGGSGIGTINFSAIPTLRRAPEYINEHSRLTLFEFDATQPVTSWMDDSNWTANFEPPVLQADSVSRADKTSLDRYLFHRLSFGTQINQRYLHHVDPLESNMGLSMLTVSAPLITATIASQILNASTVDVAQTKYAPKLVVETYHGHNEKDRPDFRWQHFQHAPAILPGRAEGYVAAFSGAFKPLAMEELPGWLMSAAQLADSLELFDRLQKTISRSSKFQRTLQNIDEFQASSVGETDPSLPLEVLHLRGLNSPTPVYSPTDTI